MPSAPNKMMKMLLLCILLYMFGSINPQKSDLEEIIYTAGQPITVMRNRGKSLRLGNRRTPFIQIGDLKNPPGTYPWEVSVGLVDPTAHGNWLHYCGGVIVSNFHVVTSANCLDFMVKSVYVGVPETDIHIRAGDHHLKIENEIINLRKVPVQEIKILNYTVHPEFNRTEYDAQHYKNIAVIRLEKSLKFEDISVAPIYLPTLEEAVDITKYADMNLSLVVSGWGKWTSENGIRHGRGEALRDGVIASFGDTYCEATYNGTRLSEGFTDDVMCGANPLNLAGLCCGDDGSGVVKLDHGKERFILTGILSLGTEWNTEDEELCCGHKNKPNIFVRVASESIISFLYETIYGITTATNHTEEVSDELNKMEVSQYVYDDCGLNNVIEDEYNYNDETKKISVWPWLVSLRREKPDPNDNYKNKWTHFCGGTILSSTRILTAAHCVEPFINADIDVKIRAGDALLNNNIDDEGVQEVVIQNFTVHPDYTPHIRYFDLAILELVTSLTFTKFVRPICLLSAEEAMSITKSNEEYLPLTVAGWGRRGEELKNTVVAVFSEETCNRTHPNERDYNNLVPNLFTEDTMCAGDPAGEAGTCQGDSGSGAVSFEQGRQRYVLEATVSGSAHGYCGSLYFPNVYIRMANLDILQWIFDEIGFFSPQPATANYEIEVSADSMLVCTSSPAIPAPAIEWIVTDEHGNLISHEKSVESTKTTPEGFVTSSFVNLRTSKAITVQCHAKNIVEKGIRSAVNQTEWGSWGPWTLCSKTCGVGTQTRKRRCSAEPDCPLEQTSSKRCSFNMCLADYSNKTNACIWGFTDEDHYDITMEECKSKCTTATSFFCNSLEYLHSEQRCFLSSQTGATQPDHFQTPCSGRYSNIVYLERGPGQILIQSEAGAAEYQGERLGYYNLMPQLLHERPAYQQRGGSIYLYYNKDKVIWYVSKVLGVTTAALRIKSNAHLPPTSGWTYYNGKTWADDDTSLNVTKNSVDVNWCSHTTVSSTGPAAAKYPSRMGRYSWTGEWLSGRKVYSKSKKLLRVKNGMTSWGIGYKGIGWKENSGNIWIRSGRGTVCPCSEYAGPSLRFGIDGWQYSDAGWKTDMSIKVTCD